MSQLLNRVDIVVIIGRIIGWIFIGIAFLVLGHDILQYLNNGSWQSILLGELWFNLDPQGLNFTQAIIQRYLFPSLWDPIITTVLLWPAWLDFLVPGVILVTVFYKRRKQGGSNFSS
ncbi:MAG: hypothetical protein K9G33_07770 [Sneathiella sp.]|nr:hypothetical protein [Sneathiella sp.]